MSRKFNQASWEDELEDFDEDDIHYYESEEEEERPKSKYLLHLIHFIKKNRKKCASILLLNTL